MWFRALNNWKRTEKERKNASGIKANKITSSTSNRIAKADQNQKDEGKSRCMRHGRRIIKPTIYWSQVIDERCAMLAERFEMKAKGFRCQGPTQVQFISLSLSSVRLFCMSANRWRPLLLHGCRGQFRNFRLPIHNSFTDMYLQAMKWCGSVVARFPVNVYICEAEAGVYVSMISFGPYLLKRYMLPFLLLFSICPVRTFCFTLLTVSQWRTKKQKQRNTHSN